MPLTGRFDFRKTFFGKLVLQVEDDVKAFWSPFRKKSTRRRWRRARLMDVASPEMRPLMDLRSQPNYHVPVSRPDRVTTFERERSPPVAADSEGHPVATNTEERRISAH